MTEATNTTPTVHWQAPTDDNSIRFGPTVGGGVSASFLFVADATAHEQLAGHVRNELLGIVRQRLEAESSYRACVALARKATTARKAHSALERDLQRSILDQQDALESNTSPEETAQRLTDLATERAALEAKIASAAEVVRSLDAQLVQQRQTAERIAASIADTARGELLALAEQRVQERYKALAESVLLDELLVARHATSMLATPAPFRAAVAGLLPAPAGTAGQQV
jgi:hypothetical protein